MRINAVSLNETPFTIKEEDKPFIKEIRSTYIYNPESETHLCELISSYELRFLHTQIVFSDMLDDDKQNELEQRYCFEGREDIMYIHCSDVRSLKQTKECGEFESMNEAIEYLQGNWPF